MTAPAIPRRIPNLRDGKLAREPESVISAQADRAFLERELARIREQLDDPARAARLGPSRYKDWRRRAAATLRGFEEEHRLLGEWVERSDLAWLVELVGEIDDLTDEEEKRLDAIEAFLGRFGK
jgi:hypothetical protein